MRSFFVFKRGFFVLKKDFSTSLCLLVDGESTNLTKEEKDELLKDIQKYQDNHPKPSFVNPGYPDCGSLSRRSNSHEDYEHGLDKFKNKYSENSNINSYNEKRRDHITEEWKAKHPDIPSKNVEDFVEKEQSYQYSTYETSEDYENVNVKEVKWLEKIDEKAWEHGEELPKLSRPVWARPPSEDDSGVDDNGSIITPSVASSPSSSDLNAPSERARSEEFCGNSDSHCQEENDSRKRSNSEETGESSSKKQRVGDSPIDYVVEKQSTEMPDLYESDGGE